MRIILQLIAKNTRKKKVKPIGYKLQMKPSESLLLKSKFRNTKAPQLFLITKVPLTRNKLKGRELWGGRLSLIQTPASGPTESLLLRNLAKKIGYPVKVRLTPDTSVSKIN